MKKIPFFLTLVCVFFTLSACAKAFNIEMTVNVGDEVTLPETIEYDNFNYDVVWNKKNVNTDTPGIIYIEGVCAGLEETAELYILVRNSNISISNIEKVINYSEKSGNFKAEIAGNNKIAVFQMYKRNDESSEIIQNTAVYTQTADILDDKVEFSMNLSEFEAGQYIAEVSSGNLSASTEFVWIDADGFIKALQEMSDGEDLGNNLLILYEEYSPIIEIQLKETFDSFDTETKKQILKSLYASVKQMSDVSFETVKQEFDEQIVWLIFLNCDDAISFFETPEYSAALGLDISEESYYRKLTDKNFIKSYIANSSAANADDIKKAFYESVAVASLNQAKRGEVYRILSDLYKVKDIQIIDIEDELSKLNSEKFSETEKNQIWAKMALKTDYTTSQSIKAKLNEEINVVLSSRKSNTGGSSGGGSSSFTSNSSGNYLSGHATVGVVPIEHEKELAEVFEDLEDAPWAREYIINLYKRDVVNGNEGKFRPNDAVTRAEFSAILSRAMGIELVSVTQKNFTDVDENAWYRDYVYTLAKYGIIKGVDELHFNPDGYLTREDMCVLVYRVLEYTNKIVDTNQTEDFRDNSKISDYAVPAVKYLQSINAVDGMGNNLFMPKTICSRAMICKVICDAL